MAVEVARELGRTNTAEALRSLRAGSVEVSGMRRAFERLGVWGLAELQEGNVPSATRSDGYVRQRKATTAATLTERGRGVLAALDELDAAAAAGSTYAAVHAGAVAREHGWELTSGSSAAREAVYGRGDVELLVHVPYSNHLHARRATPEGEQVLKTVGEIEAFLSRPQRA
ncbi:hypothetical protein [Streptomyces noursei]